ncbi:hypothetical protein EMCRGX_G005335 [Ephydatia muelleri]
MEWRWTYPEAGTLRCPLCSSCFWRASSYETHVRRHRVPPTKELWVCSVCSATFSNKTEVKKHFDDNHTPTVVSGRLSATETEDDMEDWLQCDFCSKSFPSNRGLLNHERAMHQAQRLKILAAIKAKTKSNRWTEDEVDRFKRLIQTFGLKSNKLLARKMGSKSVRQVEGFKRRFLQKHPLWRRFDYGTPALDSSPHPSSTDTSSSHSSPSLVAVTNEAPSPTTTDITQPCLPPRAQSSLLNKADDLIIALRAPVPSLLLPSPEAVHRTAGPNLGTLTDQHTLVTSESQPLASVSLAPVEYERLRLDFTDRDYANNRESSLPSSLTTPELNPIQPQTESQDNDTTTDTITIAPAASQVIRSVISDIRRCFEAESDDTPQAGPERDEVAVHQAGPRQDPNRRTGLNPDAPPFLPRHRQSPNSQRASQRELQSNSEVVQTMFQARLSHLTEKRWLSREEWGIFCSALDDLTKFVSELCFKNHQNNNRNGQRGWRQRNARQPGRDSNRSSGRERRIREMVDIQKLYRKNPK